MQVKVYIREESLEELKQFLLSNVQYQHSIEFDSHENTLSGVEVYLFYNDFVRLRDCQIEDLQNRKD